MCTHTHSPPMLPPCLRLRQAALSPPPRGLSALRRREARIHPTAMHAYTVQWSGGGGAAPPSLRDCFDAHQQHGAMMHARGHTQGPLLGRLPPPPPAPAHTYSLTHTRTHAHTLSPPTPPHTHACFRAGRGPRGGLSFPRPAHSHHPPMLPPCLRLRQAVSSPPPRGHHLLRCKEAWLHPAAMQAHSAVADKWWRRCSPASLRDGYDAHQRRGYAAR